MKKLLLILSVVLVFSACNNSKKSEASTETACAETSACAGCPSASSCGVDTSNDVVVANADVKILYFHATHRCETCNAVEKVTKAAIADLESSKVSFQSFNREVESSEALVQKYEVSGQTLLLTNGTKTVNLTSQAFLYARSNPEKLTTLIQTTISEMK